MTGISGDLLNLLQCPRGGSPLEETSAGLYCPRCGLRFAVQDGIPILLMEQAQLPNGVACFADLVCEASPALK